MSNLISSVTFPGIELKKGAENPLYLQLYNIIRQEILSGRLRPGQKLPATRVLAKELRLSRTIIALAFDQLRIEGYIKGKVGSGTFINDSIPEQLIPAFKPEVQKAKKAKVEEEINYYGLSKRAVERNSAREKIIPFQTATPSLEDFPYNIWTKIIARVSRKLQWLHLGYENALGFEPLQEAIADYLRIYRAVKCEPGQVIITTGTQQGLNLSARVLLKPKDKVWMEDPGYTGARAAFFSCWANVCPVPVSDQGIDLDYAIRNFPDAKLAYITPSHQYPLGGSIPLAKRFKLLEWANESNMYILEDDYDSELRYSGHPLAPLQGLDGGNKVIYLGSFSKVLFPGLRLGYLVVPPELIQPFTLAKLVSDRQSAVFEQAVLAEFISEGHFERHLRRMRILYKERQDFFFSESQKHLQEFLQFHPLHAGMHLVGRLAEGLDEYVCAERILQKGVIAHPVKDYTMQHYHPSALLFGYTAFNEKKLSVGIKVVKEVFGEMIGVRK